MAKGRGSAMVVGVALLCLMVLTEPALGAVYTVGGPGGWTFNVASWTRGKPFRAGDVLVFNYARSAHNVVPVNARGFNSCNAGRARGYQTGRDRIRLRKGHNYFICTFPGHCQGGMKIDAFAR